MIIGDLLKYIIDSTVFASIITKDEFHEIAYEFFYNHSTLDLITLDLTYIEVANVLWKHVYILKRIRYDEYKRLRDIVPMIIDKCVSKVYSSKNYLSDALEFSIEHGIPIYDSLFIVVTIDHKGKLVTFDSKLLEKLRSIGLEEIIYSF